jgi:hypothetical protein
MTTRNEHWLLRVADGVHFRSSQKYMLWSGNSGHTWVKNFRKEARPGDILWFIKGGGCGGKAIGVATFTYHCPRVLGPLIALTPTNEDLGWTKSLGNWDVEIHYKDLYDTDSLNILTKIQYPLSGRRFNPANCHADLPLEFANIVKYSSVVKVNPS